MKTLIAALFTVVALQAAPAHADPAATTASTTTTASATAASPLVGRWALDVEHLPMPPQARPKSVTVEFRDPGAGQWSTHVEIVHGDGSRMHADSTLPLDGTPGPVAGNYWANVAAVKMPAPNVLVVQLVDHGAPASTRAYSVTGDNDTLTETKAFFTKDGTPVLQTTVFKRVK